MVFTAILSICVSTILDEKANNSVAADGSEILSWMQKLLAAAEPSRYAASVLSRGMIHKISILCLRDSY